MSRCDLEIVLERQGEVFRGGDRVVGMVIVRVNVDCTCNGLSVAVRWATHGRGNRTTGVVVSDALFTGEWKAGEEHIHPFELVLPEAMAPTYAGTLLNVDWEVMTTADIPWAFDPEMAAEIEVELAPGAPHWAGPLFEDKRHSVSQGNTGVLRFVSILVLAVALMGAAIPLVILGSEGGSDGELWIVLGVILVVMVPIAGLLFWASARKGLAEKRLGEVALVGPTQPVRGGERAEVVVRFTPTADIVGGVVARLVGKEEVVSGSGSNRRTHSHPIVSLEQEVRPHGPMPAGQAVELTTSFAFPVDAQPSFEASDNALRWEVEVAIAVDKWPDWDGRLLLHVAP